LSTEVFVIAEVFKNDPPYYQLKDNKGEQMKSIFYEEELMRSKYPHHYLVEKVLRKRGNKIYG
jgi:hypothetical protein